MRIEYTVLSTEYSVVYCTSYYDVAFFPALLFKTDLPVVAGGSGIRASPKETNGFVLESGSPLVRWLARVRFGSMSGTRQKQLARQPVFFVPLPIKQLSKDPIKQIFCLIA